MKLDKNALGLAFGIISGICMFLMTLWIKWLGDGGHLYLMRQIVPAYKVTFFGAVVALIFWFIYGYILGWLLAWLYNRFVKKD